MQKRENNKSKIKLFILNQHEWAWLRNKHNLKLKTGPLEGHGSLRMWICEEHGSYYKEIIQVFMISNGKKKGHQIGEL